MIPAVTQLIQKTILKLHCQLSDKQPIVSTIQPVVFPLHGKTLSSLKLIDQALFRNQELILQKF